MKIDFTQALAALDGSPIRQGDDDGAAATLLDACATALTAPHPGDERLGTEEKLVRYRLLKKIHEAEPTLSVEEVAHLKRLLGVLSSIVVIGACCDLLDPQ